MAEPTKEDSFTTLALGSVLGIMAMVFSYSVIADLTFDWLNKYGDVIGATLGTFGAYSIARWSMNRAEKKAKNELQDVERKKRRGISIVVRHDLVSWMHLYENWNRQRLRSDEKWYSDLPEYSRLDLILNNADLFGSTILSKVIEVDRLFRLSHHLKKGGTRFGYTRSMGVSIEPTAGFYASCVYAYCELMREDEPTNPMLVMLDTATNDNFSFYALAAAVHSHMDGGSAEEIVGILNNPGKALKEAYPNDPDIVSTLSEPSDE